MSSEPVKEMCIPNDDESNLLENTSDDDDDFAFLTQQRVGGVNDRKSPMPDDSGNLQSSEQNTDFKPFEANFQDQGSTKTEEDADFFNMNSADTLAAPVDLMHIEKNPSNVDLLGGATNSGSAVDMLGGNNDSFDPFQAFSIDSKSQEPPPVKVKAPKKEDNTFDPFGASNEMSSSHENLLGLGSSNSQNSKPRAANSSGDLMGDWNTFVSTNSSPNLSRNSSHSNLGAGANIPYNSSGNLQPMGGSTSNIPSSNSGTFQGIQMGGNIPRNNSGTFQPMGGISFGTKPAGSGTGKPADPFAEFGKYMCLPT